MPIRSSIARACRRFALKFYAAELLNMKLFGEQQAVDEKLNFIRQTQLYRRGSDQADKIFGLETSKLQQFVRAGFCSIPLANQTDVMKRFMAVCVYPALQISVASVPNRLASVSAKFTAILGGSLDCSDQDMIFVELRVDLCFV